MEKYYTPDLSEIHIEFECEIHRPDREYLPGDHKWRKTHLELFHFALIESLAFRVKYLDHEDIESLGWVLDPFYYGIRSNATEYRLSVSAMNPLVVFIEKKTPNDWIQVFEGELKNKSELKRIMKMVGITETTEKNGTERS